MQLNIRNPRKSINKAYMKAGATQGEIAMLKNNLGILFGLIDEEETEEHVKNDIRDFLCNTFYKDYYVNTVGRTDLAIHLGKDNKSPAGILMECKKPLNKNEMIGRDRLNAKAMHELMLYYLRQRIEQGNNDIRHLVITNVYEWFVFDATEFEKHFFKNKQLVKDYKSWAAKEKVSSNTDLFYKEIAAPFLEENDKEIECTFFDLRSYAGLLKRDDKDRELVPLLKLLSPAHLLKLPFANDSNRLEKSFYYELLHLIGLEEQKEKSKKLIRRPEAGKRKPGSLLENTIKSLETSEKLRNLKDPDKYGDSREERLFNVALELNISWINRILFLKLLEAQLQKYHKGDESFRFLNTKAISDFDELNELFFEVLARREQEREPYLREKYSRVPYLNSSLFEINSLEFDTIIISNLKDRYKLPLYNRTVLRDDQNKRRSGELPFLQYLFEFLDAYDFSSEGSGEVLRESKALINASVLGLIFEKINGYREGSYFTPGFITMYMCRETIRRAVVQKFNNALGTSYGDFGELKREIDRRAEGRRQANQIINNLKICDPAVGSGHFLVSALNEIIAIKSELGVLSYRDGSRVQHYNIEIENDELIVTDEESQEIFEYTLNPLPGGKGWKAPAEKQKLQECLFHEKQNIIENCLFGVDINPNSVKICRLRLWIELLKNAYYKEYESELETLPNIDINIKQGNSLISRFSLDTGISELLKRSNWSIEEYRLYVDRYRNAASREEKRGMMKMIEKVKSDFRTEIGRNDPKQKRLDKLGKEYYEKYEADRLLEVDMSERQKAREKKERQKLEEKINKLSAEIKEIKDNKIYLDAFEWRFEFPEVLDEEGDFVGFDVVIGNPPYIGLEDFDYVFRRFFNNKYSQLSRKYESSVMFIIDGFSKLTRNGILAYIAPVTWQTGENYIPFRKWLLSEHGIRKIINLPFDIFEDAYVETGIYILTAEPTDGYLIYSFDKKEVVDNLYGLSFASIEKGIIPEEKSKVILNPFIFKVLKKLNKDEFIKLGDITISTQGLSGSLFKETNTENEFVFPFLKRGNIYNYTTNEEEVVFTSLEDKKNLIKFYQAEPKVLIRRIVNRKDRLSVTFYDEKMVFKKDINPFIPIDNNFDAKYLTGILASNLISFIYINVSSIATKDDFRQTTLSELRDLLIPVADKIIRNSISDKVTQILTLKQRDPQADTGDLEAEIDRMVYQLYGLTEEEVKVVEETNESISVP